MRFTGALSVTVLLMFVGGRANSQSISAEELTPEAARNALRKAVAYFTSLAVEGGYVYFYSLDLQHRWGESKVNASTVEVQAPGTPAVGACLLRAYRATGERYLLEAAEEAAKALVRGQNRLGGWTHTIDFSREPENRVSLDDNQTQGAISFLMDLDRLVDHPELSRAVERALAFMMESQMEHGGWPHQYPAQGNYHDFATFNDAGINDCIRVMLEAHRLYGRAEYLACIERASRFLVLSQLPPPQPGWAQQYNDYLQPAWARSFEPPAVCPLVTVRNILSLLDLYLHIGDSALLEPIPDALSWLEKSRLPNGKWPRFVELHTGKALYYDRGRIRVDSVEALSVERRTGYGYEQDLSEALSETRAKYERILGLGREGYQSELSRKPSLENRQARLAILEPQVLSILDSQDSQGRWTTPADRFRKVLPGQTWNGEYEVLDRISSRVFIGNVQRICDYLELMGPSLNDE